MFSVLVVFAYIEKGMAGARLKAFSLVVPFGFVLLTGIIVQGQLNMYFVFPLAFLLSRFFEYFLAKRSLHQQKDNNP